MQNVSEIKVISVDLFRTLAKTDVNYEQVWKTFLGDRYSSDLGRRYWDRTSEILFARLEQAALQLEPFKTTRDVFAESYRQCFTEIGLDYDPDSAAETLIESHQLEHFYEDAGPFLKSVSTKYRVCLATDCDTRMTAGLERLFHFEKVFISEEMRSYKAHPRFFSQVLDYYGLQPQNILHIGDSRMDILTPGRLGLQTCWLNRGAQPWQYEFKPDYQVQSLIEILPVLGLAPGEAK
jgi:HAD superfamily hydrolase (TIGR01509 family)